MCETMIIGGEGDEADRVSALDMAPGLGLIRNVVIDTHFAQRGRSGRLLGAVTENPKNLGLGIDENTAIVVDEERPFTVIGDGSVHVFDGSGITYSSLSEGRTEGVVSIFGMKVHILGHGDQFDMRNRQPIPAGRAKAKA